LNIFDNHSIIEKLLGVGCDQKKKIFEEGLSTLESTVEFGGIKRKINFEN